jgi:hypothetical protein
MLYIVFFDVLSCAELSLTLFVLRVLTDYHYTAVSLDDLALVAHRLY